MGLGAAPRAPGSHLQRRCGLLPPTHGQGGGQSRTPPSPDNLGGALRGPLRVGQRHRRAYQRVRATKRARCPAGNRRRWRRPPPASGAGARRRHQRPRAICRGGSAWQHHPVSPRRRCFRLANLCRGDAQRVAGGDGHRITLHRHQGGRHPRSHHGPLERNSGVPQTRRRDHPRAARNQVAAPCSLRAARPARPTTWQPAIRSRSL